MDRYKLNPDQLKNECKLEHLEFNTTEELEPLKGMIGQDRGIEALKFGLKMNQKGYNIFVTGLSGTGRSTFTNSLAEEFAKNKPVPSDWVYVYNFEKKDSPKALKFDPGEGKKFKEDVEKTIKTLREELPERFDGKDYITAVNQIYRNTGFQKASLIKKLNKQAEPYGFMYEDSDEGLMSIPLKDGQPMQQEEYELLEDADIEKMTQKYDELEDVVQNQIIEIHKLNVDMQERVRELDTELTKESAEIYLSEITGKYGEHTHEYFEQIKMDISKNVNKFKVKAKADTEEPFFNRYTVNLFIDNSKLEHAHVVNETNPIYNNLVGEIDYESNMGALTTDFTKIKPGSLHYANGGYLIFQMDEILSNPISWELIMRAIKTNEINIENMNKAMGLTITSSIKPEPIPLDVKILIIGDEYIYSRLYNYNDEFRKLFKVKAAFDTDIERTPETIKLMAQFVSKYCADNNLKQCDKSAVAKLVEYSSRICGHRDKITTEFNKIAEILTEADLWASEESSEITTGRHVKHALEMKKFRSNLYELHTDELFEDDIYLIDTDGYAVGQINGLAVMSTGDHTFGKPSRITANVYCGKDGVINIEREANQSGNSHDKGVMIISGYIGQNYAQTKPLGLNISIGFEQNYGMIDGDSASSTELYAILSAMSDTPINQGIAVTGSVNQKGQIQPIGGVNEKIEGFYGVCKQNGLTGSQGVIIPIQNLRNLMLNDDVINAVKQGQFHIYAVKHIEEGIKILTGEELGKLNFDREFPEGTINHKITERLSNLGGEPVKVDLWN